MFSILLLALLLSCYKLLYTYTDNINWIAMVPNSSDYLLRKVIRTNNLTIFSVNVNKSNSQILPETIPHPTEGRSVTHENVLPY